MFIRILKYGILSLLVLLMLFAYDVSAGRTSEDIKIEELIDRFGLQQIETIPEDVEPLYFNTVDELENYLINAPNFQEINCEIQENHFEHSDYRIPDDFSILTTCGMVTRNCTANQAMAKPSGLELDGFYYIWKCMICGWPTEHCLPPNQSWKYCEKYICEGGVGCWFTGDARFFCCDSNP